MRYRLTAGYTEDAEGNQKWVSREKLQALYGLADDQIIGMTEMLENPKEKVTALFPRSDGNYALPEPPKRGKK